MACQKTKMFLYISRFDVFRHVTKLHSTAFTSLVLIEPFCCGYQL